VKIVMITGCCGFLGKHLTRLFLKKGYYVYGVDKLTYAADKSAYADLNRTKFSEFFKFINADIKNLCELPDLDYIINTAAESHVGHSITGSDDFMSSNVEGVRNLLNLIAARQDKPVFVQLSTDEVVSEIEVGSHTEDAPHKPGNPYSASKAAADMLVMAWHKTFSVPYILIRPTNLYGKGQHPEKMIPLFLQRLQRGLQVRLHDQGLPKRSWLHVRDAAEAILFIVENGLPINEVYNIAGADELKNNEVAKHIIDRVLGLGLEDPAEWVKHVDYSYNRPGQDVRYSLDGSKLAKLGWVPKRRFVYNIQEIIDSASSSPFWGE